MIKDKMILLGEFRSILKLDYNNLASKKVLKD
jgi:hypothetical protein